MDKKKLLIDITHKRIWQGKKQFVINAIIATVQIMIKMKRINHNVLVSVRMTDDKDIQKINRDFRSKDKPTNVLSFQNVDWQSKIFDLINAKFIDITNSMNLYEVSEDFSIKYTTSNIKDDEMILNIGDIVLSYETIASEAGIQHRNFDQYLQFMTIHGMLHLMGYDHQEEFDAEEMSKLESVITEKLLNEKN